MTRAFRLFAPILAVVLTASACGAGDGEADGAAGSVTDGSTETTVAEADADNDSSSELDEGDSAMVEADPALCEALLSEDVDELAAVAPPGLSAAIDTLEAVGEAMEGESFDQVFPALEQNPTVGTDLLAFADSIEGCDPEDVGEFRALAGMLKMWEPESDQAYCDLLADEDALEPDPGDVIPEHADAFARLDALDDTAAPTDEEAVQLFADIAGLGLYAEGRCGVTDAFSSALLGAAFMLAATEMGDLDESDFSIDDDSDDSDDGDAFGDTDDAADVDPEVSRVPAAAAIEAELSALLPADGRIAGFDEVTVDLDAEDNPGQYLAMVIVPQGWEADAFFGVSYGPPESSDVGFFTDMSFDAACQGVCEAADDWAERFATLNGDESSVTSTEVLTDPDGELIVADDSFIISVLGGRWSAGADRMLTCDVDLDEEDADLVELFSELCRRAQPLWF